MSENNTDTEAQRVGTRRAAIALVGLREERAAAVLSKMDDDEVKALTEELLKLGSLRGEEIEAVLTVLVSSLDATLSLPAPGVKYASEILAISRGSERGSELLAEVTRPEPFTWLMHADPDMAATVLAGEPPQEVALALSQLGDRDAKTAAALLVRLPEAKRHKVAQLIGQLAAVNPTSIVTVDEALQQKVGDAVKAPVQRVEGATMLAGILNATDRDAERDLLTTLTQMSPELAEEVKAQMFTFEDLLRLDSRALQKVLGSAEMKDLAVALRGVSDEVKERIFANVSERARDTLEEEIDLLGSVRAAEVADARKRIVAVVRTLEAEGTITIERAGEEVL